MNTQFLKAGQLLHKKVRIGSELGDNIGLLQTGTTITLDTPLSEAERRDIVGGKLTYANGNTTIITGYTNTTVISVKDSHSISSSQIYDIDYGSNTVWGTIIGANSTQILYTVGSIYVDPVLPDITSVNNFINGDTVMVYDPARTKAYATKSANSHDSALTHTGITFELSNTPAVQSVNSSSNVTITDAFGQSGDTVAHLTQGAFTTSTKNTGAISACQITAGGEKYEASPVVTVTNGYMSTLGNALDITGANNSLVNLNLHTYTTGTITQTGNVVTLSGGTFPDANSGLLKIEYANGNTDFITSVTNTSSVKVETEKNFGINDAAQTYKLTYMAIANNFVKNSYVYNDDFSARAKVLDFIDKPKPVRPYIADGNTTLRFQMTTVNTFSSTTEYLLMENEDIIAYEDDPADGLFQGSSRVFTETGPTSERLTSYTNTISTVSSGTITQKGFYLQQEGVSDSSGFIHENGNDKFITDHDVVVTIASASFPNDVVRGTLVYADSSTTTVTGFSNSTTIEVETSKAIGSGQTYDLNYNGVVTWGEQRTVTAVGSGSGNRTVTVTDTGHNLRTGDKIKFTGALTTTINGTREITVLTTNTYSFTLPEDGSATINGELRVRGVVSAYLSSYNTYTVDTSLKGNNATVGVSAIAIGAIKTIEVYNFGAGYTSLPTLSTTTGNRNAVLTATLGAFAEYAGYYTGGKGLLSGTPKLQDNRYYQDFSYVLKTDFDVTDYRDSVKRLVHPSGMLMFGEVAFRNKESAAMFDAGRSGDINSTDSNTARTAGGYSPRYRVTIPTINSFANVQHKPTSTVAGGGYQSYLDPSGGIIELQTMKHPWQAMDGKIDVRNDENLLIEDFRNVTMQRTHAEGSIIYATITETLHNLEVGDEIQITKATQDFWNGRYEVSTVPNSNSYTVVLYRGDPGAGAAATAQTATGGGTIKVETLAFANGWRANTSNWETPFNDALSDELDNERILLEQGGTFLYPKLSFPTPESGATTIDMSFNSDILLEDLTEDGPAYLLDETSGTAGQGPVRFISLEEDTDSVDGQYSSIPQLRTHVNLNLFKGLGYDLLMEDGSKITYEDTSYVYLIAVEEWTDGAGNIIGEDGSNLIYEERTFWFGGSQPEEHMMLERQSWTIKQVAPLYQYVDKLTSLGRLSMEDGSLIENEDDAINASYFYLEKKDYGIDKNNVNQVQFNLQESLEFHLMLEDGGHFIEEGDESTRLARFITGHDRILRWFGEVEISPALSNVQVQFIAAPYYQPVIFANTQIVSIGTSIENQVQFNLQESLECSLLLDVEVQADLVDQMGWHILMENDDHLIHEDRSRAITEENPNKTSTIEITPANKLPWTFLGHLLTEDSSQIFCAEDDIRTQLEDEMGGVRDGTAPEFNLNLYENSGYNLFMEDGSHMILENNNIRISTEEGHVKTLNGEVELIPGRTGGVSDYTKPVRTIVMTTAMGQSKHRFFLDGVQHPNIVFEPGVYYKWDVSDSSNFDNDSGEEHLMAFSTTLNGHHNSGSEYTTDVTRVGIAGQPGAYILMKMPESGNLYYYCAGTAGSDLHKWMAGFDNPAGVEGQGLITPYALSHNFAAIRTSKTERKGPEQMSGQISIPHNGTTVTGTNTVFTDELRVGDVFHTGDENILLEDTDFDVEILLETDERLEHETMRVMHVEDDVMEYVRGVQIRDFRWFISSEDSNLAGFATFKFIGDFTDQGGMQDGIQGGYDLNTTDESFYLLGEDSQAGDIMYLEDDSGQLIMETSDALSDDLLLEDGTKILFTEPGEFKISSITDDDTLVVTRKHWGGTDAVPFWKQTTWNFLMENDDLMVFESGSGVPLTEEETSITSAVRYT